MLQVSHFVIEEDKPLSLKKVAEILNVVQMCLSFQHNHSGVQCLVLQVIVAVPFYFQQTLRNTVFSGQQDALFSWKKLHKILLNLIVQMCVNMTYKELKFPCSLWG